jgi:large subunit ribosomal protein L9
MKLILTAEVPKLGAPGDIVEVRDGYGRNYLLPQGKAIVATRGAEKQIATIKRAQMAKEIRGVDHAKEIKATLETLTVRISARATGDGSKLFGSISNANVASAIRAAGGPSVDRHAIDVGGHIKSVGAHTATVKLHPGVVATVQLLVVATS